VKRAASKDETMRSLFEITDMFPGHGWRGTFRWRRLASAALLATLVFFAGCHGDPNVRKQKYLESGKRYSDGGKYKEAAIQFANAIRIDKSYADAHYELAKAYLHLGQAGPAYGELSRTVALQPANYQARIDLSSLLLAAGKPDEAKVQADAVLAAQPDNADAHALLSGIASKKGQRDQALAEIQRALALNPNRATFHEQLALLNPGDAAGAASTESELKKAIALDPKSANPELLLAAFYASNNRWQEAEQTAREATDTDPKSLLARETLARIYLRQNDPAKAESVLRQASSDLSDNPQAVRVLADYYENSGQPDKARQEYQTLATKHPEDLALQEVYVRSLVQVKDYGTAQSVVSGLMKKHSKDPQVLALNGIVLLNAGKSYEAASALQSAVMDYPKDAFIQFWLGKAALARGDLTLAEKSFRQAAELRPPGLQARQELALIATQKGDVSLLSEVADKTIALAPTFAEGYLWRASVEMTHNSSDQAEADLQSAMKLAPSNPVPYLQLGKIRLFQKRFPEGSRFRTGFETLSELRSLPEAS
jgi:Tfp pilus assembly protein PilF